MDDKTIMVIINNTVSKSQKTQNFETCDTITLHHGTVWTEPIIGWYLYL